MSDLQDLIPVVPSTIGTEPVQTINARDLHKFLESKQKFADWAKSRVAHYGFIQGVDFITIPNSTTSPPSIEYHLTLDMAKELAMVERNARGKRCCYV